MPTATESLQRAVNASQEHSEAYKELDSIGERRVVRCERCLLVQFWPSSERCRRCKTDFKTVEHEAVEIELSEDDVVSDETRQSSEYLNFSHAVAVCRIACGISQQELANRMKTTRTYVSKIENRTTPTLGSVSRLAKALGVSTKMLVAFALVRWHNINALKAEALQSLLEHS